MAMTEGTVPGTASPPNARDRLKRLVERAYMEPDSRLYRFISDLTAFLVMVSLLSMVLEGVPELSDRFERIFFVVELVVVAMFILDYAASVYLAERRWGYVFSFWGMVDLLAIMPFFLTFTNVTGLRAGRTLHTLRAMRATRLLRIARVLRVVRIAKLLPRGTGDGVAPDTAASAPARAAQPARTPEARHGHGAHHARLSQASLWHDFQFGVIAVCSLLALAEVILEWDTDQLFWLALGGGAAADVALRRMFLRRGQRAWAALCAAAGFASGASVFAWAVMNGDPKAASVATVTLVFTVGSILTVERPATAQRMQAAPAVPALTPADG